MDDIKIILQIICGIVIIMQPVLWYVCIKRMRKKHADLPSMNPDELRTLATKQPILHCHKVIEELKNRNEDFSFALPVLLKLAVDRNPASRLIGWGVLKQHFAGMLPELDFSKSKPNSTESKWIKFKLNQIGENEGF